MRPNLIIKKNMTGYRNAFFFAATLCTLICADLSYAGEHRELIETAEKRIQFLDKQVLESKDGIERMTRLYKSIEYRLVDASAICLTHYLNDKITDADTVNLLEFAGDASKSLSELNKIELTEEERSSEAISKIRRNSQYLSAVTELFEAIAKVDSNESSRDKLTVAAIELELFVDDPNANIAESARLWQALAYRIANKPERALKILYPAVKPGTQSRVDLYCRFERCRSLAADGQFIAAASLAAKTQKMASDWFGDSVIKQKSAIAASLRLNADIHQAWSESLAKSDKPERAKYASDTANTFRTKSDEMSMSDAFWLEKTVFELPSVD